MIQKNTKPQSQKTQQVKTKLSTHISKQQNQSTQIPKNEITTKIKTKETS